MWRNRIAPYAVASAMAVTGMFTLRPGAAPTPVAAVAAASPPSDAPYRDGLFQGRLAAERCRDHRPGIGRWVGAEQRARFAMGYHEAYWGEGSGARPASAGETACRAPGSRAPAAPAPSAP
jgi:hypothetical protein